MSQKDDQKAIKCFIEPNEKTLEALFANAGGAQNARETNVGTNGYEPGQEFVVVGLEAVPVGDKGNEFVAFRCKDGAAISVKQVMGLSSLQGFTAEKGEILINEFFTKANKEKQSEEIVCKGCESPEDRHTPSTRNFYEFVEKEAFGMIGGTLTYLGEVARQNTARKDSDGFGEQKWKAGYKRVQTAKLWKFTPKKG